MTAAVGNGTPRDPFGLTANPDGYYPTAAIERVLADAQMALEAGNVPVIAGPTGLGKTLVLQLIARAREPQARAIYIPFCTLPPEDLARLALGLLGVEPGADPEAQFLAEARRAARDDRSLLLLVDDAAALPGETAAQLANWLTSSGGALEIVLAGLPGASLRHARDAFGDRAEDLVLVSGLRPEEIRGYVHSRLAAVGAGPALRDAFDDAALAELARVSEGNPRRMNLAAQAIARSLRAEVEEAAPSQSPDAGTAGPSPRAHTTAADLMNVGEYRFVRGRFVDPESGEARAGAAAVPHVEKPLAPLPPRQRSAARRPAYTPPLEIDRRPEFAGEQPLEVDEEIPPPVFVPAPVARPERGVPYRWIAAGVAVTAVAAGAWWQLGSEEEDLPVARVTVEPVQIKKIGPPAGEPAVAVPDAQAPPIAAVEPAGVAPGPTADAPAPPPAEVAVVAPPVAPVPRASELPIVNPIASPPDVPASPAPAPLRAATEPAPPPPPAAETVPVAINATPWAVIEVDGKEIGETPLAGVRLEIGRHLFRARMPDGSVQERVIRIDTENTTVVFE